MYRIGVVGTRGGWSSEKLLDMVEELTGVRVMVEMDSVRLDLDTGEAWYEGADLSQFDALIVKKIGSRYSPDLLDRIEILRFLAEDGTYVFSSPSSIAGVVNRLNCTVTLKLAGIPIPPTTITESVEEALQAVTNYGHAVLKPMFTSKARGMRLIQNDETARKSLIEFKRLNPMMYIQKKIDIKGQDLGVAFLGNEYLTTYARAKRDDSWTTSTAFGGTYEKFEPSHEIIDIAHRAQEPFKLDFTCVDVVETDDGPVIFEVSAFGGFRGIYATSDIDIARIYTEYVIDRLAISR
jgi:ATP-grasp enzyme of GAK system